MIGGLRDIIAFLVSKPDTALCAGCVAMQLDVSRKKAHEAMLRLEARVGFARHYGRCAGCRTHRIVATYSRSPAISAAPDGSADE